MCTPSGTGPGSVRVNVCRLPGTAGGGAITAVTGMPSRSSVTTVAPSMAPMAKVGLVSLV